ncbi:uncharacterized protein LOC127806450 [Diospyros lotus]|uniref:uncharacterized protein LOC127806450 n=1 Tax=Diospyros lotus TaxID=55363 RepID=UPI002251DE9F|nr:uncharacterized protein LOC127806450 [Diospyros lotus]
MEVTHYLGGENYVFCSGWEGYQTLLNTDMERELNHLGTSNSILNATMPPYLVTSWDMDQFMTDTVEATVVMLSFVGNVCK